MPPRRKIEEELAGSLEKQSLGHLLGDKFSRHVSRLITVLIVRSQFINGQEDEHAEQAAGEDDDQKFG